MNESSLFQGITVFISGDPDKKLLDFFKNGKGQISKFTMEKTNYILCGKNYDESQLQEAIDLYEIPGITEQWILNSVRMNKLASIKAYSPKSQSKLFNGFIFTMTQVDQPDRLKLYAMITFHGGAVQKDLDNKVTHLISGGAQSVALKLAGLSKMTIITPDWVLECLKQEKLVESEIYHPSLLISPVKQQKIIMPTGDMKSSSIMRNQLQQNIRQPRPMVVQMQHTPQQINEIIQSQIQQQQMQEQAKLRAQQAAQVSSNQQSGPSSITNVQNSGNSDNTNPQTNTTSILQVNQIQKINTNPQQTQQQQVVTTSAQMTPGPNVCIIQPNQNAQNIQQNQTQMNVSIQQQGNQVPTTIQQQQQRQIALQQQLEANARNQKIQLISQQLQQATQNQIIQQQQQQQMKQFQTNQIITTNNPTQNIQVQQQQTTQQPQQQIVINNQQQFIATVQQNQQGNVIQQNQVNTNIVPQNQMINTNQQAQNQPNQQFGNQTMKQILTTNQPQNQQFIINQSPNQNIKTITSTTQQIGQQQQTVTGSSGANYIQIIQQGQPIIQIQQHSDGNQIHQKNIQQTQQQNVSQPQQIQVSQQMQTAPNVSIQSNMSTPITQNIGGNIQQQVPSSPQQTIHPQQTQQTGIIQNQGGRQNIVIINQLQNPQNVNQMSLQNQRFQTPQGQFQKTQIGTQQIIQQKLLTANDGSIVQHHQSGQPQQIIQVHQTTISGGQIQQQNVEGIIMDQKMHNVQAPQQTTQQLTQAQAVHQIAQQLQSAEILSQNPSQQQSQMPQQTANTQMNIISNQAGTHQVVQSVNPGTPQPGQITQTQRWIPQSPTQPQTSQPLQTSTPQSPIVQHIITTNQQGATGQQFIRATGQRLGPIYLDAQSSIQFQRMDQAQRQEYLEQLHNKQQQQQREGVMFQQRPTVPNTVSGPRHIVIRSQVPPGLTTQQQIQWISSQRRPILIRQPNQVGMTQINQPVPNQIHNVAQIDPNATPQQQQLQRQHFQRLQQMQQTQKMAGNVQTPVSPRGNPIFPTNEQSGSGLMEGISQQITQQITPTDVNGVSSNKTKTALANMLSNRLGGNSGNIPVPVEQTVVDQSASGTLRMMTAQHALNVQGITPVVRNPQELIVLQQQQQQQIQPQIAGGQNIVQTHQQLQQRRTLGNITNAQGGIVPTSPVIVGNQMQTGTQVIMPPSPSTNIKQPPFSPGRAPPPQIVNRPQFYGHNPNLKLPPDLCLLGCHFLIVEYDETNAEDLEDWTKSIKYHGGEIEACYNLKISHVLCKTQKHGIVMQAIRDNKRCVTAYWLNDIILKKQVIPPWQAIHLPSSAVFGSLRPGMKHIITIMGFENDERERVKRMIEESGAKLTTYLNRQNTVMVCKRLDQMNKKYLHAKEFNIPMVNVVWLSDLLLGNTSLISQFESPKYQQYNLPQPLRIDHSIVPQLMNAWKAPINLTQEAHEKLKRSQMEPPPKKLKKMRTIPLLEVIPDEIHCIRHPNLNEIPIVMFSHVDNIDGLSRAVMILGGRITQDHNEMTHLVMTKPNRTLKFLYALCSAKYIISSCWLEDSAKAGYFQTEDNYWIKDLSEMNYKCDVLQVIKSPIRNRLFENRVFYITPNVKPAPSYLRWLIERSGGKWEHNRRSVMKIHELNQQSPNSYIVVSCPEDLILLGFKHYVCYVCTSEFILQSIMTQTMDFLKSELQLSR